MSTYLIDPPDEQCTSREAVRKNIHDNAVFSTAILTMNALATVVACYGLLEASGVVLVLCMALLIGVIHRDAPLTREILARTRPMLLDLIIALAGGAAGA